MGESKPKVATTSLAGCFGCHMSFLDIDEKLVSAGWPEEGRGFAGHLTICRIKNPKAGLKLCQAAEEYKNFKCGVMEAESVKVYESKLTPQGPVYTVVDSYELK